MKREGELTRLDGAPRRKGRIQLLSRKKKTAREPSLRILDRPARVTVHIKAKVPHEPGGAGSAKSPPKKQRRVAEVAKGARSHQTLSRIIRSLLTQQKFRCRPVTRGGAASRRRQGGSPWERRMSQADGESFVRRDSDVLQMDASW